MSYVGKNYFTDGGDTLIIGGTLAIEEGAEVTGLPSGGSSYTLPTATDSTLGGVKVGSGLSISDGVLSATGITPAANQASLDAESVDAAIVTAFNSLLSALKTAGLMVADN